MIVDDLVKAVLEYLKSKNQLELLPQVAQKLTQAGWTTTDPDLAAVTSASALSPSQKQALKLTLSEILGRSIRLKTDIDPGLLAGLRIAWDGKVIDTSLNQQLIKLNEALVYE